jgi:hypothetical protein
MNKEIINEIIRLIKVNTDNNLILLKELIEQRARLEKLEKNKVSVNDFELVDTIDSRGDKGFLWRPKKERGQDVV